MGDIHEMQQRHQDACPEYGGVKLHDVYTGSPNARKSFPKARPRKCPRRTDHLEVKGAEILNNKKEKGTAEGMVGKPCVDVGQTRRGTCKYGTQYEKHGHAKCKQLDQPVRHSQ